MGKYCTFAYNEYECPLTDELIEIRNEFYQAVKLPVTPEAQKAIDRLLMQTVGRVQASETLDNRTMSFLKSIARQGGKQCNLVGTHQINDIHVEIVSRYVFSRADKLSQMLKKGA